MPPYQMYSFVLPSCVLNRLYSLYLSLAFTVSSLDVQTVSDVGLSLYLTVDLSIKRTRCTNRIQNDSSARKQTPQHIQFSEKPRLLSQNTFGLKKRSHSLSHSRPKVLPAMCHLQSLCCTVCCRSDKLLNSY